MLGTPSGLLGNIYLTAMFSLGFSLLYRDEGRGWLGSKRTDPTEGRDHTEQLPCHMAIPRDAQITTVVISASCRQRSRSGSSPGEIVPELLLLQARMGVLSLPQKTIILGGVPLPPDPTSSCCRTAKQ